MLPVELLSHIIREATHVPEAFDTSKFKDHRQQETVVKYIQKSGALVYMHDLLDAVKAGMLPSLATIVVPKFQAAEKQRMPRQKADRLRVKIMLPPGDSKYASFQYAPGTREYDFGYRICLTPPVFHTEGPQFEPGSNHFFVNFKRALKQLCEVEEYITDPIETQ
ncbi:hypothetical protein H0H81_007641 [Sphagnurus paluster]|uniref:Uncharacterized protein n=1 Tax=Sphagnurus paluster TaxID=117069 RepID=A0A9P7K6N1_9AGAR|nr:hypothetical protein H0H81_007641 [Sphagnurus paluster]